MSSPDLPRWRRAIRRTRPFWSNIDAVLIVVAAAVVIALDTADKVSDDTVRTATLGILALLTSMLVWERHQRRVGPDLDPVIDYVEQRKANPSPDMEPVLTYVREQQSDRPYEVLGETMLWKISNRGRDGVATMKQELRFIRGRICVLDVGAASDATQTKCEAKYRLKSMPSWKPAPHVRTFSEGVKSKRFIFSLEEARSLGDVLDWQFSRTLKNAFTKPHQVVKMKVNAPSASSVVQIQWDQSREPTNIQLNEGDATPRYPVLKNEPQGFSISEEISGEVGSTVTISWDWV